MLAQLEVGISVAFTSTREGIALMQELSVDIFMLPSVSTHGRTGNTAPTMELA
jgi:hypothetical protein